MGLKKLHLVQLQCLLPMLFRLTKKICLTAKVVNLWRHWTATHSDVTDFEEIREAFRFIWGGPEWSGDEAFFWMYVNDMEEYRRNKQKDSI